MASPLSNRGSMRRYAGDTFESQGTSRDSDLARNRRLIEQLSHWMDTVFEIPLLRWRFGLDAIIGLIPGVGDAATTMVSLYIIALAGRFGLPKITLARMALNVAIDMLLGSLPLVGDLFDVWWKANQRNTALMAERLTDDRAHARRATLFDWLFVAAILVALGALFIALVALVTLTIAAMWRFVFG